MAAPAAFSAYVALQAVVAFMPGLQVWAVGSLTNALAANEPHPTITRWVVVVATVVGLQGAALSVTWLLARLAILKTATWLRCEVNASLALMSPAEAADPEQAKNARLARDAFQEYGGFYARNLIQAAQGVVCLAVLFMALWPISPWSAALLLLSLLVSLPFLSHISKLESIAYPEMIEHHRFGNYFADQLTYQRTVSELISLGAAGRVATMANRRYQQGAAVGRRLYLNSTRWQLLAGLLAAGLSGLAIWLAAVSPGRQIGGAAAGVVALLSGSMQASETAEALGTFMSATGVIRDAYAFLDQRRGKKPTSLVEYSPDELVADHVSYAYPRADRPALEDVSLRVRKGEVIALVGANGAGKTTLINCLAGLYTAQHGDVRLDGRPLHELSPGERLGCMAILTQEFGRYEFTVRENLALARPQGGVSDEELWSALRAARADGFVRSLPGQLDAQLGQQWGGTGLSGGQWQRLALARIFLRRAAICFLDEPTAAVDAITEEEIFQDLIETKASRATILVSHRAWTLRNVDRIYVMAGGKIVEVGSYSELLARGGEFARMFHFQAESGSA